MTSVQSLEKWKKNFEDQEKVYKNILEGTMAGYWDWHIAEDYEYLSPTFKSMFGYEDHEMENHPSSWQKIIFQEDLPKIFASFEKHVETKGASCFDAEARYTHKNGSTVWVYCRGKVIEWDENGAPLRAVGSHVDITKMKTAEENEKRYSRQLETKNKELEQFAYVASHDLKEPIRTINNFGNILIQQYKGQLDEQADQILKLIIDSTERMNNVVDDLLKYSSLGHEKVFEEINTNDLIRNIQRDLNLSIKESNASFELNGLPTIQGHPTEIRLLFQNLISNALKFRKSDSVCKIKISAEEKTDLYHFQIADNGIGIDLKNQEQIFNLFQRLHTKNDYKGTGIGLAHCKKIVGIHNGNIWVESTLGEGSCFHFTIKK